MSESLPSGWTIKESKSRPGVKYYFNERTGESRWEAPSAEDEVRASHILKKHSGSRRPASWRCDNITQSKNEAISQIKDIKKQLEETLNTQGQQAMFDLFAKIASTESDCSSAERGGDLGSFSRGKMQKSIEDASFALNVGQLSDLVDSDSGIHIILRLQ